MKLIKHFRMRDCRLCITLSIFVSILLMVGCGQVEEAIDAEEVGTSEIDDDLEVVELPPIAVAEGDGLPDQLPSDLEWLTNDSDPEFASVDAIQGGTFRTTMSTFPLTLRLVGPDSNGSFTGYLRYNNFGPVSFHPYTRRAIPAIATHWAFGSDGRSIYYRINPNARWSDGEPVTSDDFVFAVQFMRSEQIVAPWYNNYYTDRIRDVKAYDEYTYGVQGADAKPMDEMHYNYGFGPKPRHFHVMSNKWVEQYNWSPEPTTGPYHVGEVSKRKYIDLDRTENWWANEVRFYRNRFNPTRIRIKVIRDVNTAWQHFLKAELDTFGLVLPDFWHDKAQGEEFDNGYVRKFWLYNQLPQPSQGMYMNTNESMLSERDVRYGIAHALNFERVINTILRGDYERLPTFQLGFGDYDNTSISPRTYDLVKAAEYFERAGFIERDDTGILVRDGERLSFVVSYGQSHHTDRLVILKEEAKKAGLELELQLLDGSAAFKKQQEKKHQISWGGWASQGLSPRFWEHFHSDNAKRTQTNNITAWADPAMDELIMQFRGSSDLAERIELAHVLEQMVHDSGVMVPSFQVPYTREAAWRWVRVPKHIGTPTSGSIFNTQANSAGIFSSGGLLWIDAGIKEETLEAKRNGESFGAETIIQNDYRTKI
ncbi:MAG: extracellular solute-binding protein [Gammaproteobacteria bacterium]|nr:extracellular solute-binding protein [Gammaproteobacteria bacterium]